MSQYSRRVARGTAHGQLDCAELSATSAVEPTSVEIEKPVTSPEQSERRTRRLSFRGAPKARARNPYSEAVVTDPGLLLRSGPGMTASDVADMKKPVTSPEKASARTLDGMRRTFGCHSGARQRREPGIHNPSPWLWIPASLATAPKSAIADLGTSKCRSRDHRDRWPRNDSRGRSRHWQRWRSL